MEAVEPPWVATLLRMAFRAKTVNVSTTPVAVVDASKSLDGAKGSITNVGAVSIYIGGDDMTSGNAATTGIQLPAGGGMDDIDLVSGEIVYAVTLAGSSTMTTAVSGAG